MLWVEAMNVKGMTSEGLWSVVSVHLFANVVLSLMRTDGVAYLLICHSDLLVFCSPIMTTCLNFDLHHHME